MQRQMALLLPILAAVGIAPAMGQDRTEETPAIQAGAPTPRFPIQRFSVEGNTLLAAADIERGLAPFTGPSKDFADVQRALEQLESLYRVRGFNTVYVSVPEQELEKGVVRLRVVEGRIGKVTVEGNRYFGAENIRRALPMLREGDAPVARRLSENIQLANENPAKEVEVVLGLGDREGDVNARVKVKDERPWRLVATLDNTGSKATGQHRLGVSFQHNNIADTDQSLSLSYMTSPDKPEGVRVDVYSVGYRIPLYRLGDSIELLYANSTVGVPSTSPSLAGGLGIVGKGSIYSARYNWLLPRQGEYASRVVLALDERDMDSACRIGGSPLTGASGCEPYRVQPFSATYVGRWQQPDRVAGFSLGVATNIGGSSAASYDLASGNRNAPTGFTVWRMSGTVAQVLPKDWQLRVSGQAQFTDKPLVPTEQIGLAGSTAVRGYLERIVATDEGHVVQAEIYTPELAGKLSIPGSLRALAFYDFAAGRDYRSAGRSRVSIASAGVGLRYTYSKTVSWRFDFANILDTHSTAPGTDPVDTGWRGHFSLNVGF